MKSIKIALIDSGISKSIADNNKDRIYNKYRLPTINSDEDYIGHGTAISHVLLTNIPQSIVYSIKVFDEGVQTNETDLIDALNFIDENLNVDIVHISNGINLSIHLDKIESICNKLYSKGTYIVSAFDNQGVLSYPAALTNVIGVYWDRYRTNVNDFIYVNNSPVNILGYAGNHFLPWINNEKKAVSGSSFTAAYITSLIAKYLNDEVSNQIGIWDYLKKKSSEVINYVDNSKESNELMLKKTNSIKKAILFPVSKEIHALLGNTDLLDFEIVDIFDHPFSQKVGRSVSEFIHGPNTLKQKIKSISQINWEDDFDTVILGHMNKLDKMFNRDYIDFFIEKSKENKKNLYCFDNIAQRKGVNSSLTENFILSPYPNKYNININTFGNLHKIPVPILGVVGTSSQQGKFNMQISLRREFLNMGYEVGQMGTEPTSYLFGMEISFPNGYDSYLNLNLDEQIFYMNKLLSDLREKEIILIGTQSQTIPYSFGNLGFYPIDQMSVLLASEPDAIVLCVNPQDEFEYILRTIEYLKNYMQTSVIALCLFPFKREVEWNINVQNLKRLDSYALSRTKKHMHQYFNIPVYINGEENNELAKECIDFFASE